MIRGTTVMTVAAALVAWGCTTTVVDGGALGSGGAGGGDDAPTTTTQASTGGGGGGPSTSTGGQPVATTPAVAMTRARLDQLWDEYWQTHDPSGSSTSVGGGPELDPNDLFLRISDLGASCSSPTTDLTCGGHWELSVGLPAGYQGVGVYDLDDPALSQYAYMSETGEPYSPAPDDCSWGGGSLGGGTLEILSIDATEVRFRLSLGDTFWDSDPSGDYAAPRCP